MKNCFVVAVGLFLFSYGAYAGKDGQSAQDPASGSHSTAASSNAGSQSGVGERFKRFFSWGRATEESHVARQRFESALPVEKKADLDEEGSETGSDDDEVTCADGKPLSLEEQKKQKLITESRKLKRQLKTEKKAAKTYAKAREEAEKVYNRCRQDERNQDELVCELESDYSTCIAKLSFLGEGSQLENLARKDALNLKWLKRQLSTKNERYIFLAFGHAKSNGSVKYFKEIVDDVQLLGYRVIYDADSAVMRKVAKLSPEKSMLGISGNDKRASSGSNPVLVLTNPYERMEVIAEIPRIVMTADSILGMGVLLEHHGAKDQFIVLNQKRNWSAGLSNWTTRLDQFGNDNLGIRYHFQHEPKVALGRNMLTKMLAHKVKPNWNTDFRFALKSPSDLIDLFESDLASLDGQIQKYLEKSEKMKIAIIQDATPAFLGGGACIFGSGRGSSRYHQVVEHFSHTLARHEVPVATGGAEGFMGLANRIAKASKGLSIGIPVSMADLNEVPQGHFHDLTVPAQGYEERIPLILRDRRWVVLAPGGSGTMKELGVTFVDFAARVGVDQDLPTVAPQKKPALKLSSSAGSSKGSSRSGKKLRKNGSKLAQVDSERLVDLEFEAASSTAAKKEAIGASRMPVAGLDLFDSYDLDDASTLAKSSSIDLAEKKKSDEQSSESSESGEDFDFDLEDDAAKFKSDRPEALPRIVFLGHDYYAPLARFLASLGYPKEFMNNLILVNDPRTMNDLIARDIDLLRDFYGE